MQTIPESQELGVPPKYDAPQTNSTEALPPSQRIVQHLEPLSEPPEPDHTHKQQGGKHMTGSTSLDSLLSLTDLEFGMEERAVVTEDTDGLPPPRKHSKQEDAGRPRVCYLQG